MSSPYPGYRPVLFRITTDQVDEMIWEWKRIGLSYLNDREDKYGDAPTFCTVPWLLNESERLAIETVTEAIRDEGPAVWEIVVDEIPRPPVKVGRRSRLRLEAPTRKALEPKQRESAKILDFREKPAPPARVVNIHRSSDDEFPYLVAWGRERTRHRSLRSAFERAHQVVFETGAFLTVPAYLYTGGGVQKPRARKTIYVRANPPPGRFESNYVDGLGWLTTREAAVWNDDEATLEHSHESIPCEVDKRFDPSAPFAAFDSWLVPGWHPEGREIRCPPYDEFGTWLYE